MHLILEFDEFTHYHHDPIDYDFKFSDGEYNYYQIYNSNGIKRLGSPTWCIKNPQDWNNYVGNSNDSWQYVIIKKGDYLPVPNDKDFGKHKKLKLGVNLFKTKYEYFNKNPNDRIGITYNADENKFHSFDDDNINSINRPIVKKMIGEILKCMQTK